MESQANRCGQSFGQNGLGANIGVATVSSRSGLLMRAKNDRGQILATRFWLTGVVYQSDSKAERFIKIADKKKPIS
jgi:hypothetical protein